MIKLIGENNKVNYGCIDDAIEWNYEDFILRDFFNKEIKGGKKKRAYHQFNYIGITAGEYMIGFAIVDLGSIKNVFGFLYKQGEGLLFESDDKALGGSGKMDFPRNPDAYVAKFQSGKTSIRIEKSHEKGVLNFNCNFKGRLKVKGSCPYSMKKNNPLRVLNPSDPNRFTFTEKCSPLRPNQFQLSLDGKKLDFDSNAVTAIYDWTGGYLRRETNWYWTAFGAVLPNRTTIGANLAAFVNETYFSENAFWINNKRSRISRVIYDFDVIDPYQSWHVYDEAGTIDLTFTPEGERNDKINAGPLVKTVFRQFVGTFEGYFHPEGGNKVEFKDVKGFCETHRAIW
ncbi:MULTISPECIES: DUF2804 domain-containing protein [unclassified Oceanispirochaeta]|uniref:DUF2804 domain-containing protein n=1 Tax=unclassified Oceanispirochaeta TaxID=2635722 RepID=UPI000E091BD8|nr:MULTISPECIES: DUF2804 domain-containing protein [unclassified Oceanispirochaeta]RDG30143.1 DUF2804 domain-containing protein [Oceanispirochaeta sp. M1]